jgi:hypothetical protein
MKCFIYALTILFVGLKLAGYIDWSWWLVLLPMIIMYSFSLMIFVYVLYKYVKASPLERTLIDIKRMVKEK